MSPLWIEEEDGTCSSPPISVSSFSGTTSKVCRVWLMPTLAFIWSAAGVISELVCTPWAPAFPFSSSSTQEPQKNSKSRKGGQEGSEIKIVVFKLQTKHQPACHTETRPRLLEWKLLTYMFLALTPRNQNGCAVQCIHAYSSLCHCPANSLYPTHPESRGYVIFNGHRMKTL